MTRVARFDAYQLQGKTRRTPQGFLVAEGALTRSGIFPYRNPDGSIRREYRPPEEVFHSDALNSFADSPLTVDHPGRMVTSECARDVTVGLIKETPRRDGDVAVASVLIIDAQAIADVESGRRRQLSCGYTCDFEPTPGVTPEGERYDGVQRNIRGNHVALVPVGRAGPEACIRLDSGDAVMVIDVPPLPSPQEPLPMAKLRIDGVDYDAPNQLAQAMGVALDKTKTRVDSLEADLETVRTELEKERARADAATEEAAQAKQERDSALSPEALRTRLDARLELERSAQGILGSDVKLDALDDLAIQREVVLKVHPDAKERLDGADATYLQARYDAALEAVQKQDSAPSDGLAQLRQAASTTTQAPVTRNNSVDDWRRPLAVTTRANA